MAKKKLHLALQGGGAHGAFTWGVIDHLLDQERLEIDGISGASAGAVNAVLLVDGLARGGPSEAEKRLADFWRAASRLGNLKDSEREVIDRLFWFMPMAGSPLQSWFEAWSKVFSPYDLNPLNLNPLRDLMERFVDFEAVRQAKNPLFVSATNVETGRLRIFTRETMSADVVAASACLPQLFRAVEIDGVAYWDGGYVGNPTIFPLLQASDSDTADVLIVQINPLTRPGPPTSNKDIMNRVNEVTFNSSLLAELREIDLVNRLLAQGAVACGLGKGEYRRVNVHRIALGTAMGLHADSKLNNDYDFFLKLRCAGIRATRRFLDAHFDDIGERSTLDLSAEVQAEWG